MTKIQTALSILVAAFSLPSFLFAQDATGSGGGFSPIIGLLLMFAVFFFLIIWPQSRRAKKHAEFVSSLEKGDEVVTQSGLYGKIYGLADRVVTLEIAPQVRIRVDRQTIASKQKESSSAAAQ